MARVCGGDSRVVTRHISGMNIPILILAAGHSARMRGVDKLMQDIDGEPLLRRMTRAACAATDQMVLVALPVQPHARYAALEGLAVTSVAVADASEGINASLRAGMAALPKDSDAVMVLLADLPNLTTSDISIMLQAVDTTQDTVIWRGSTTDGKPGHPVVFHRSLFAELCALTGDSGAQSVVRAHADKVTLIRLPGQNARLDLDTPEDWDRWIKSQSE